MCLIHLRIRAKLPVILMGETGIGKTFLVDLLAAIMTCKFETLNIHAGVTDKQIIEFDLKYENT